MSADEQEIKGFLARQISAVNAYRFYYLLRLESEKHQAKIIRKKKTKKTKKKIQTKTVKTKKTGAKKTKDKNMVKKSDEEK